jgi:hypothetical protein
MYGLARDAAPTVLVSPVRVGRAQGEAPGPRRRGDEWIGHSHLGFQYFGYYACANRRLQTERQNDVELVNHVVAQQQSAWEDSGRASWSINQGGASSAANVHASAALERLNDPRCLIMSMAIAPGDTR